MRGERGFALVITLIVTALLTALLVEFVNEVYVDTSHSHNFVASQQAGMLAESGVTGGIKLLKYDLMTHQGYSSLLDLWAAPQSYDAGVGKVTVTIEEESGKLDLNSATSQTGTPDQFYQDVAKRLLTVLQLSPDLYDALSDWVDTDDTPRPGGGESTYYAALKPPIKIKNDRLDTVEELALIKGFTPDVMTKLKPCVTVYGGGAGQPAAKININTAPKELIAALSDKMSTSLVNDILEYRKTKAIKNLSDVPTMDSAVALALQGKVSFAGDTYRIHSEAKVGETTSIVEAVIRLSGTNHTVLYWREY